MENYSLSDIKNLSITERISIVEEIWDSIVSSPESLPVTDAQKIELDMRLKAYEKQPEVGSSWPDVKERIKSKL